MGNPDRIEVGDKVAVHWSIGSQMIGVVVHVPVIDPPGDVWHIRCDTGGSLAEPGSLSYVQQYDSMNLLEKGKGE